MPSAPRSNRLLLSLEGRLWWPLEWLLLAVATVNLVLVVFYIGYLPMRDFYVRNVPEVTRWFDPYLGIEPHRVTERYLETVDQYAQATDAARQQQLLASLRQQSAQIIDDSPFQLADKQGTLERIKNRIRVHMTGSRTASSKQSFLQFWSAENLSAGRRERELAWFNQQLRPLFALNYYRNYAEDGSFVDTFFWRIDLWFMIVFAVEWLLRSFVTWREFPRLGAGRALGENSFSALDLLPAVNLIPGVQLGWIALVRVFTWGHRLERLEIFPSPVVVLIHRFSALIADEVTDRVVINVLGQMEDAVRKADLTQLLPRATQLAPDPLRGAGTTPPTAIDGFVKDQAQIVVKEVLPEVRPELEKLIAHNVRRSLPLADGLAGRIASVAVGAAYGAANEAVRDDPEGEKLLRQFLDKLFRVLGSEWREHGTMRDAQELIVQLLEEARLDYIRRNELGDLDLPGLPPGRP